MNYSANLKIQQHLIKLRRKEKKKLLELNLTFFKRRESSILFNNIIGIKIGNEFFKHVSFIYMDPKNNYFDILEIKTEF